MRIIALMLLVAFASCRKYTCQCTVEYKTTMGSYKTSAGEESFTTTSKKRADYRCEVFEIGKKEQDTTARCALL